MYILGSLPILSNVIYIYSDTSHEEFFCDTLQTVKYLNFLILPIVIFFHENESKIVKINILGIFC